MTGELEISVAENEPDTSEVIDAQVAPRISLRERMSAKHGVGTPNSVVIGASSEATEVLEAAQLEALEDVGDDSSEQVAVHDDPELIGEEPVPADSADTPSLPERIALAAAEPIEFADQQKQRVRRATSQQNRLKALKKLRAVLEEREMQLEEFLISMGMANQPIDAGQAQCQPRRSVRPR